MIDIGYALSKLYSPPPNYTPFDSAGPAVLGNIAIWRDVRPEPTQAQLDAAVIECENDESLKTQQTTQLANAKASLLTMLNNLDSLSAEDAAYAMMGRAMAIKDGASQVTIDGIINRATSQTYLTGKTEWINLPATAKAWLADQLDMEAKLFQVIIIALRR